MEKYIIEAMKYFSVEEWTKMDGSEHLKYAQVLYIYFACIHLGIQVVTPQFLSKQETVEEELEDIDNKCKYCKVTFVLKEDNIKHMNTTCRKRFDFISQKKKHACNECNYSTNRFDQLNRHKLTHTKEKKFICNLCEKAFLKKDSLKLHVNVIHLKKDKAFKCNKCSYETIDKSRLTRHSKIHSDIKQFLCEICNKRFNRIHVLKQHLFQHSNKDKPFQCLECEKRFVQKSNLTMHMNAIHLKIKQFKCNLCEYSTGVKSDLKRHSYTHVSDKPYKCSICDYQCVQNGTLKRHFKNRHSK